MDGTQRRKRKSTTILRLIADGHSYAQIVDGNADITYLDIFAAAEEALKALEPSSSYDERMARVKQEYSRAYERWTDEEDKELAEMSQRGSTVSDMTEHLGRQPSAIRSRLRKLGLF